MHTSPSITRRATLAVLLMLGFYLLALTTIGVLILIPFATMMYSDHMNAVFLKIGFICLGSAGVILWSILPRLDKFVAPGPILDPNTHPQLFATLTSIAEATKQAMPAEVYLIGDMNAWVTQRGGFMGIGSRRVMGIGLPLLAVLNVSQLRAILAHEFGHYYGGDTKLGPWIYKTRSAIGRTIYELGKRRPYLQAPFLFYGKLFLRITHAVSRQQEFAADEQAARLYGSRPLIEGLKRVQSTTPAFMCYYYNEMVPALRSGFRPPLVDGFRSFLNAPLITEEVVKHLNRETAEPSPDPYDTHPPTAQRIAVLQEYPEGDLPKHDPSAISLLENLEELEGQLIAPAGNQRAPQPLQPIAWHEVGMRVWIPIWDTYVRKYGQELVGVPLLRLPDLCKKAYASDQQAYFTLGSAVAVALHLKGWNLLAELGEAVVLERDGANIKPFVVVPKLASGDLPPESWYQLCMTHGIEDVPLVA